MSSEDKILVILIETNSNTQAPLSPLTNLLVKKKSIKILIIKTINATNKTMFHI